MEQKQRVIVYIDGFNFSFGLKSNTKWKKYYWLDVVKLFEMFMRPNQELVAEKYFTAKCFLSGQQRESEIQVDIGQIPEKIHNLLPLWKHYPYS